MLDVVSSENREKTLRFVLMFYRQATDRLPTHYQQSADCQPTVGRQVAYISGKTCRPTDDQPIVGSTGFLGSSSSQLPENVKLLYRSTLSLSLIITIKVTRKVKIILQGSSYSTHFEIGSCGFSEDI